jgi:hypothetical protein
MRRKTGNEAGVRGCGEGAKLVPTSNFDSISIVICTPMFRTPKTTWYTSNVHPFFSFGMITL